MEWMEGTDAATVAQAQAGDAEAFRALVERHSRNIFRLAYRMTGNEHDAEEVVQETFLRAYRRISHFEARSNFGTWLYRIATNCSYDLMRTRHRHEEKREPEDPEGSEAVLQLAADGPTPDRVVFSAEVQQRVSTAMADLSAMERAAFVLRHFEGRSIEEISKALGLRAGATKNSIFRAVQKLRRALEPVVSTSR